MLKPGCFPALVPGFRIWIEKLKYKMLKVPGSHPMHLPVGAAGSPMRLVGAERCFSTTKMWQVHNSRRDNSCSEGLAHPSFLRRCLYLMITYLGVTFWNWLKGAYLIINTSQKLLKSHRLWKKPNFNKVHLMYIIVKVCRATGQPFEYFQIWICKGMLSEAA